MKDVTFLYLVKIDSVERLENTIVSLEYLLSNINTNIFVLEISNHRFSLLQKLLQGYNNVTYSSIIDYDDILYRTKYINNMIRSITTEYVAVWDVDVIIPYEQLFESVRKLREGQADIVYPYRSEFLDVPETLRILYLDNRSVDFLNTEKNKMRKMYGDNPVGGAFICRVSAYYEIGLESEDYYGWGREDGDRYYRWQSSKYLMERIEGQLFHLNHPRGKNSTFTSKYLQMSKLRLVNKQRLMAFNKRIKSNL